MEDISSTRHLSTPLNLKQVQITDHFWEWEQELVRREVIPYQWKALNDQVPGAEPSYCMHNFRAAGALLNRSRSEKGSWVPPSYTFRGFQVLPEDSQRPEADQFYGFVFQDTDFSKWIEAVGCSLAQHPDPQLERTADQAIDIVCAAQHESGYLDTYYIINGMDQVFTNLRDHHELYCLGHLIEGAIAYYEATGKRKLLDAACRFADYAASRFGTAPGQVPGYPGHEIAEMALIRLYEVTGVSRYLELSLFFLNQRGTQPLYFDLEEQQRCARAGVPFRPTTNAAYHQAHLPVREQREAIGHAVRGVYLYSAMADAARITGDEAMLASCRRLWDSIVREKLYLTGGIGGTHVGEAFSFPYDLPNDTAYSETCAAIGLVFFARRMLQLEPRREYADVMELALYNTVLAGMSLDGKQFFYVNPLSVVPEHCRRDPRLAHVKPVRQKWFGCACCPPNLARLVSSVGSYVCTASPDTLWIHLYVGCRITKPIGGQSVCLELDAQLPWAGSASMTVHTQQPVRCTLAFRIPGWCGGQEASVSAPVGMERSDRDGYCYLQGLWKEGDQVCLSFPMPVILRRAHSSVREDIGKAAFTRGPITYCMEEADNGKDLHLCRIDLDRLGEDCSHAELRQEAITAHPVCTLTVPGLRQTPSPAASPLYLPDTPPEEYPVSLKLIPYYAWANRGEGEMQVWIRT
ncbi:MAG: glycoside hydrolase family 127 protein [Candidatus Onthomonas sp.]